jgi:glycosyltransferase involved in cell wall biosynthesis
MPPRVSVVIPVFNRPAAVRRAIGSVLTQTFQDFEIVVVDDGSTDDTPSAVAAFADPRIRLIRHERKRGGSAARNTGIQASSAQYVAFLDSDDEWLSRKLERQLEVFETSRDTLGLVHTGEIAVDSDGRSSQFIPSRQADLARTLLLENVIGGCSLGMIPRAVLDKVGGFDETLTSRQDVDLWLRISEQFVVDFAPEALVRRAVGHDESRISTNISSTMNGWELFLRKHKHKLIRFRILHLYLRETGRMYHRRAKNPVMARRFYMASISARPLAPLSYLLLLTTFVPLSLLVAPARSTRRVVASLRSVCQVCRPRAGGTSVSIPELEK